VPPNREVASQEIGALRVGTIGPSIAPHSCDDTRLRGVTGTPPVTLRGAKRRAIDVNDLDISCKELLKRNFYSIPIDANLFKCVLIG
jgi:hypothetical protein